MADYVAVTGTRGGANRGRRAVQVAFAQRLKADLRVGRVRAIVLGKAQLTPEQRARLAAMLGEPSAQRPRADTPPALRRF